MSKNVGVGGKGIKGNALRRGFLTCIIGEIDKSRCVSYFSTVPNPSVALRKHLYKGENYGKTWRKHQTPEK